KPSARASADPGELTNLHLLCKEGRLYDVERWIRAGRPMQLAHDALPKRGRTTSATASLPVRSPARIPWTRLSGRVVEHSSNLPRQGVWRERLLEERHIGSEYAAMDDRVVRVAGHVQHLDPRP